MSVEDTTNKEDLTVADIMERTAYTKNNVKDFVAGGVGGIFQLLTGHPLDTMKVKLQTSGAEYNGLVDVITKTMKNEGPKGFYKGVASPFLGFTALNAILFASYGIGNTM